MTTSGLCITKKKKKREITEIPQCRTAVSMSFDKGSEQQYLGNKLNWQNKIVFMHTSLQLHRAAFQVL